MRRAIWILGVAFVVAALALPALAVRYDPPDVGQRWRLVSDTFDRQTGIGIAVLQLDGVHFAEVRYRDMDRTMGFTNPDTWLHVRYFVRGRTDAGPTLKTRLGT